MRNFLTGNGSIVQMRNKYIFVHTFYRLIVEISSSRLIRILSDNEENVSDLLLSVIRNTFASVSE